MALPKNGRTILIGEDDLEVRNYLETALRCQGYSVELAQDGDEVLTSLYGSEAAISAVLLDIVMPRKNGFEVLKEIRQFSKDVPVIVISGASSPLNIVEAMKNGANNFIPKPIQLEDLRAALNAAFQARPVPEASLREERSAPAEKHLFFGTTTCMRDLQNRIGRIGWSEAPVLIQGETGVGKEMIAREIHAQSPRAKKPFLKLNCAALPSELVESELFGYERGAFTGAFQRKPGMFELADGGTILLDEIGDMDFKLQAKLLQVLQDQEFQRLGGKETVRVDVRVIAATHRDLARAIVENTFRGDLYFRLKVINICVPPLRDRKEDIMTIAEFLTRKHSASGAPVTPLPAALKELFLNYDWPGNIRELENVIRKFLIFRDTELVAQDLSPEAKNHVETAIVPVVNDSQTQAPIIPIAPDPFSPQNGTSLFEQVTQAKHQAERTAIVAALKATRWNRRQAAVMLNVDYKALLYKMHKLSIKKIKSSPSSEEINGAAAAAG